MEKRNSGLDYSFFRNSAERNKNQIREEFNATENNTKIQNRSSESFLDYGSFESLADKKRRSGKETLVAKKDVNDDSHLKNNEKSGLKNNGQFPLQSVAKDASAAKTFVGAGTTAEKKKALHNGVIPPPVLIKNKCAASKKSASEQKSAVIFDIPKFKDDEQEGGKIKSDTTDAFSQRTASPASSSLPKNVALRKKTSIGMKLILIISTLVVLSLGLITFLVSYFVTADTRANAENSNFTLNVRTASDIENRIDSVISKVLLFADLFDDEDKTDEELSFDAANFFDRNDDIAAIGFLAEEKLFTNTQFFVSNALSPESAKSYIDSQSEAVALAKNGAVQIENASPYFLTPVISIFMPFANDDRSDIIVVIFSTEKVQESVSTGKINETVLVNSRGIVLIHPDINLMMNASDLSENEFVKNAISNDASGIQQIYVDSDGEEFYAACQKITDGNLRVITQVKSAVILAAINGITKRNIMLTVAILSIAVLVIWIFAKSLSRPLENLTAVAEEINSGNFNTDLFDKLNVKRRDEIGVLNQSTKNERDILNTVTSLTNKGVTKAIVRKEIDFEPHLKDITIFFSDIRGFTAISDGFNKRFGEKSAAEIIGFLNDYMSRMVNCISITGGVVDKFEGDAVMAAWGVLRDDNLDWETLPDSDPEKAVLKQTHETHIKEDALSAIRSTIAMRYALAKYNKDAAAFTEAYKNDALAKYKPHIRIGCGLNSGRATVGFMGSTEKMEFTSIGDAVNLASRTESSNKPCGTDILITEDTYNILKTDFIRCEENNFTLKKENVQNEVIVECIPVTFEVKGKGAQHFYGVVNMPHFDIEEFFRTSNPDFVADKDCLAVAGTYGPKTLSQVRQLLGIPVPDFEGVNLNEEENKVKIQ